MYDIPDRRGILLVVALLIGGTILVGAVFTGGHVSRVLSTVGGSVTNQSAGGPGDTTDGGSDTSGAGSAGSGTNGQVADAGAIVPTLLIVRTGELPIQVTHPPAALRDGPPGVIHPGGHLSPPRR